MVHTDEAPPVEPPSARLLAEQTEPMCLVVPWPLEGSHCVVAQPASLIADGMIANQD